MDILSKEQNWVDEIVEKATIQNTDQESSQWKQQSIYRVPTFLTVHNEKAYKPQVVSFGPYHYGEDHLKFMEQHKLRALRQIVQGSGKHIQEFLKPLRGVDQKLKNCYNQLEEPWINDSDQFSYLMLLDGCFMLEILRIAAGKKSDNEYSLGGYLHRDYAKNDPIFSMHGVIYWFPLIIRDMLMLENQLPLLVLKKLVAIETGKVQSYVRINESVLSLWGRKSFAVDRFFNHVLDVFHDSFVRISSNPSPVPRQSERRDAQLVRSATELFQAGVKFKTSKTDSFTDVDFKNGVLYLPKIVVDDTTESKLLNLMAYERLHVGSGAYERLHEGSGAYERLHEGAGTSERLHVGGETYERLHDGAGTYERLDDGAETYERLHGGAGNYVTSYVILMDNLINSACDVSILRLEGTVGELESIVENSLGSDDAVATLFNGLAMDVTMDPASNFHEVQQKLNGYCQHSCHEWRANFVQTYFRSPWSVLSLLGAILLLLLTALTAVYTVLIYSH